MLEIDLRVSPFVVDATRLRVEGLPIATIATRMGYQDVAQFRADWREAYQTELGAATPVAAAIELVNSGLLDLRRISRSHNLQPFGKLPEYEHEFLQDLLKPQPSLPRRDWDTVMDIDYNHGQTPDTARLVGAGNPVQEAILYWAFLSQNQDAQKRSMVLLPPVPEISTLNQNNPTSGSSTLKKRRTNPSSTNRKRPSEGSDRISFLPYYHYPSADTEQSQNPKLIGTILSKRQGDIFHLEAAGIPNQRQAIKEIGISDVTYHKDIIRAAEALGLEPYQPSAAEEIGSSYRILIVNALMASKEIEPMEIARASFTHPDKLVKAFNGLTSHQMQVMDLLAQGKTVSSIVEALSNQPVRYSGTTPHNEPVIITISVIKGKLGAKTRTHMAVLYEAYKRIRDKASLFQQPQNSAFPTQSSQVA